MCGSLPGVRVSAISGDAGTGTIHPPVPLRYKPEHWHQCRSAGTSVSRLWGSQIAPGSRSHPRVPKPPQGPPCRQPALCKGTAGAARSSARGSPWPQPLLDPNVGPRASPAGRGSPLSLLQVTDGGTPDSRGHQPASPCSHGSPQQLQASCVSFLWGFVTHDVSHLGFDRLVGMVVLFPCQAVAFLPPAVSGLTAIVWFF